MGERTLLLAGLTLFASVATAGLAAVPSLEKDTIPRPAGTWR